MWSHQNRSVSLSTSILSTIGKSKDENRLASRRRWRMEQSILNSTKKNLGIGDDDTSFDLDIITHINSAFSILNDLGVGPEEGFVIEDEDTEWDEFLPNEIVRLSKVKTCVFLRTKLLFDPPTS